MYQDYCIAKAKAEAFVDGVSDLDADLVADAVEQAKAERQRRKEKSDIERGRILFERQLGASFSMSEAERRQQQAHLAMAQRPSTNEYHGNPFAGGLFGGFF
tara:strand:- start:648 stop:953 length:306 start_codon:yes stop_codon:yes gene_type:complete